ncbi:MAG: hypothetical protein M1480_19730 [Bacteroidetes bacterium]|nr:hypothetical protein [Bacteroidota bacterium]
MKALKIFLTVWALVTISFILFLLDGCSNSAGPQSGNFSMSVKSGNQLSKVQSDTLMITSAAILVEDLKLKGTTTSVANGDDDSVVVFRDDHSEDNEVELKMGPFVISLNLNGAVNTFAVNNVPPGTYVGAKFQIHKLDRDEVPPDSIFADSSFNNGGYSVVVKGFYNGVPFIYKSKVTANERVYFAKPIVVSNINFINVTLQVDPYSWFYVDGHYLAPNNINNSETIDWLIRHSFNKGFEDDHKDGHED